MCQRNNLIIVFFGKWQHTIGMVNYGLSLKVSLFHNLYDVLQRIFGRPRIVCCLGPTMAHPKQAARDLYEIRVGLGCDSVGSSNSHGRYTGSMTYVLAERIHL